MGEKRKVLHIVEAMGGGVFTYIVELANGLSDEFDVTIAFGIRNETPENYESYFKDNVHLVRVKYFGRSLNPCKDVKACRELKQIAKDVKPDIIHMHSSKAGALGRLIFSSKKYKMFYTPHGYSFLMEDVCSLKKNIYKYIEKLFGRKNCTTIACGYGEWEESKKVTGKSTHISNGINTDKMDVVLAKELPPEPDHRFTVYTVGRISFQKNPELFNKVAELLPDIRFLWVGEGDLRGQITSPNIEVTGWVERDEAMEYARRGDVFILPSRWEGLPISLLEAMYMKKPCLVSNVVGNRDIIRNNDTGYICNSAQEFADVIRKLTKGIETNIVDNAHAKIVNHYNSANLCRRYKEVYLEDV